MGRAVSTLLGLWIILSPFALAFHHLHPAIWNNVAVGVVVAAFALLRVSRGYTQPGWSWCNTILGMWLIASPFALHFAQASAALWNNVIAGALVALFACASALLVRRQAGSALGNH